VNGVHDMGGMHGFGKVEPEANEPVFHAPWERRVLAMVRAMGNTGAFNIDMARFSREALPPQVYLASSYYKRWQLALENLLRQRGLVEADEFAAGRALHPAKPVPRTLAAADYERALSHGVYDRPAPAPARFKVGARVRMKNINPPTHTRLPRYVRGRFGTIEAIRGCHAFADAGSLGQSDVAHWLYAVTFESRELWGEGADPTVTVSVEAWEPYLEALA
jgi:nitrile hydratase beta subunit